MVATMEPTKQLQDASSPDVEMAALSAVANQDGDEFPTTRKLVFIMSAIYLSMFIVVLVSTKLITGRTDIHITFRRPLYLTLY
jgi:hypothetical protein